MIALSTMMGKQTTMTKVRQRPTVAAAVTIFILPTSVMKRAMEELLPLPWKGQNGVYVSVVCDDWKGEGRVKLCAKRFMFNEQFL